MRPRLRSALFWIGGVFLAVGFSAEIAIAALAPGGEQSRRTPEHRKIIDLAQQPATVTDIASGTRLPVGVVRVLLADLIMLGAIKVVRQRPAREMPSDDLLREILNGLRAL